MNNKEKLFTIKFEGFEGTSSELIRNIKDKKITIDDVPIIDIIKSYIDFIFSKKETIDINVASKTISQTALILKMKSENLLPKHSIEENQGEDDDDDQSFNEMKNAEKYIEEYEKYKKVINYLKEKAEKQKNVFFPMTDIEIREENMEIEKVELSDLLVALEKVLSSKKNEEYVPIKKRFFTVAEKMKAINGLLLENPSGLSFHFFMEMANSKLEIIIIFLALLQLIYFKKIKCFQKKNYDNILFKLREVH